MTQQTISLTASNLKYLLALSALSPEGESVRCVDVARRLDVARPSALRALECLQGLGIFQKTQAGGWSLTGYGRELARRYRKYYEDVGLLFYRLLPPEADHQSLIFSVLSQVPLEEMDGVCRRIRRAAGEGLQ